MRITCNRTGRLVEQITRYLTAQGVICSCNVHYHKTKRGRLSYSEFQVFPDGKWLDAGKTVVVLVDTCRDLQLDLTTSGIKDSRGYQVFVKEATL